MEQLGVLQLAETEQAVPAGVLEFQLVAVLDDRRWTSDGSRREYELSRAVQESVVDPCRGHPRQPGQHILRSLRTRWAGPERRSVHRPVDWPPVRSARGDRAPGLRQLFQGRPWPLTVDVRESAGRRAGFLAIPRLGEL